MLKLFIPTYYYKSVYDIPLEELYDKGIRLILTDLDNTLISYNDKMPNDKLNEFRDKVLSMGFELIIVSNSRKERVTNFANAFNIPCVKFSTKPLKRGIKKAIKKVAKKKYNKNEIMIMGDQLMTDILGGNRCKINTCLIYPVDKSSEINVTKNNRRIEQFFLNRIRKRKKYKDTYLTLLKEFDEAK